MVLQESRHIVHYFVIGGSLKFHLQCLLDAFHSPEYDQERTVDDAGPGSGAEALRVHFAFVLLTYADTTASDFFGITFFMLLVKGVSVSFGLQSSVSILGGRLII
jgi:hypothetical protein